MFKANVFGQEKITGKGNLKPQISVHENMKLFKCVKLFGLKSYVGWSKHPFKKQKSVC